MSRWHHVAMIFAYVVMPGSLVLLSLFVLASSIYQARTEGLDEWGGSIALNSAVTVLGLLVLLVMNTA